MQPLDISALDLSELELSEIDLAEPLAQSAPLVSDPAPSPLQDEAPEPDVPADHAPEPEHAADHAPADHARAELARAELARAEHARESVNTPVPAPAAPALIAATPQLPAGFAAALPIAGEGGWSPVAGVPLENLGLVQLIERLALAMATRKASAGTSAGADADAAPPADAAVQAEELADTPDQPEFAPGPFSMPAAPLAPAASELPGGEHGAGSARAAILRRLGALAAGEPDHQAGSAPRFSRPADGGAVPAAAEAVVPLVRPEGPVAGASVPFETDEALRSALATLQRMTARG